MNPFEFIAIVFLLVLLYEKRFWYILLVDQLKVSHNSFQQFPALIIW